MKQILYIYVNLSIKSCNFNRDRYTKIPGYLNVCLNCSWSAEKSRWCYYPGCICCCSVNKMMIIFLVCERPFKPLKSYDTFTVPMLLHLILVLFLKFLFWSNTLSSCLVNWSVKCYDVVLSKRLTRWKKCIRTLFLLRYVYNFKTWLQNTRLSQCVKSHGEMRECDIYGNKMWNACVCQDNLQTPMNAIITALDTYY